MKKTIIFSTLILILTGCHGDVPQPIKFNFFEKIKIKDSFEYPSKLITDKEQLKHIFSQQHKPLYILKDYIDYNHYDFGKYDYLFSFGKEVIKIETTEDECDYLTKNPIKVIYAKDNNPETFIYVYIVVDKDKYRDLCP